MRTNLILLQKFSRAVQAISDLFEKEFASLESVSWSEALHANIEITHAPIPQRLSTFHRRFIPLRNRMVEVVTDSYRAFFKIALAHEGEIGVDPDAWAQTLLQPAINLVLRWIPEWYMLACDGENESVQHLGSMPIIPGQTASLPIPVKIQPHSARPSWRAPAWLFAVFPLFGFGPLKEQHVPARDSEDKLGEAHTRLLLKGARRALLWELNAAFQKVRNQEIAAASATVVQSDASVRRFNKRKGAEQREKLYEAICKILTASPNLQGIQFCAELDKRHAPPLFDWVESKSWREGLTWKEAWNIPELRRKIRRVRQEAQRLL